MHETGVCRDIVETVEAFALRGHAKRVASVRLVLGEAHDVVPQILTGAFEWMARGTVAEGAQLVIERVPFTVACQRCGEVWHPDAHERATWVCPACHERDYRLNTGREFSIESIEVEGYAPDEPDRSSEGLARLATRRRNRPTGDLAVSGRQPA